MSILDDIGSVLTAPVDAIKGTVDFLQWASWIFHPLNWLRAVEFILGCAMFAIGLQHVIRQRTPSLGNELRTLVKENVVAKAARAVVK